MRRFLDYLDIWKFVFTFQLRSSGTGPGRQISKSSWYSLGSCGCFPSRENFPRDFHSIPTAQSSLNSQEKLSTATASNSFSWMQSFPHLGFSSHEPESDGFLQRCWSSGGIWSSQPNQQTNKSTLTLCSPLPSILWVTPEDLVWFFNIRKKLII